MNNVLDFNQARALKPIKEKIDLLKNNIKMLNKLVFEKHSKLDEEKRKRIEIMKAKFTEQLNEAMIELENIKETFENKVGKTSMDTHFLKLLEPHFPGNTISVNTDWKPDFFNFSVSGRDSLGKYGAQVSFRRGDILTSIYDIFIYIRKDIQKVGYEAEPKSFQIDLSQMNKTELAEKLANTIKNMVENIKPTAAVPLEQTQSA